MATHHKVFLTERNIQSLLNKLDRVKAGGFSECNIIKCDNLHTKYPQTMPRCSVKAVETSLGEQASHEISLTRKDLQLLAKVGSTLSIKVADGDLTVTSVTDKEYYAEREPGFIVPMDDPGVRK